MPARKKIKLLQSQPGHYYRQKFNHRTIHPLMKKFRKNYQLKSFPNPQISILSARKSGGNCTHPSRLVQPGVLSRQGNRKFSSALSNLDSQFIHAFQRKQASTSCLSCDSSSLCLQFPPFRDAEAELGNERIWMNHKITSYKENKPK